MPRMNMITASHAFSVNGPRVWNNIPIEIRSSASLFSFKKKLLAFQKQNRGR